jgi:hypothetical protein
MKNPPALPKFSLLKLFLLITFFVTLFAIAIFTVNPAKQQALENNKKRKEDILLIANALGQYTYHNPGKLPANSLSTPQHISSSGIDLCKFLLPDYLITIPTDPSLDSLPIEKPCPHAYITGYYVHLTHDSFTISAPTASSPETEITITKKIQNQ